MIFDLQKASFLKRVSAFIFDAILVAIIAVGIGYFISVITGFDGYNDTYGKIYDEYQNEYGIEFDITEDEYDLLSQEKKESYDEAVEKLCNDEEAMKAFSMMMSLTLLIVSLGIFLAVFIYEFLVPLIFKNGQTPGKKIFGIGLMRTDGVKISVMALFIRTVLGKYTIEIMIPALILIMIYFNVIGVVGIVVLVLILILQIAMVATTKTNSLIHDLLANTVEVDMASQMIFNTEEDMIEYKKKCHLEKVTNERD